MAKARHLLALDCAGSACSAAVWSDGAVKARRLELMERGHSERLVPMVAEVMAEAGAEFAALEAIATTLGPGGFTGVRIGLATARGLALGCRKPLLGVSNFEAVAAAVPKSERRGRRLAVLLESKRAEVYVQLFGADLKPVSMPGSAGPGQLDRLLGPGPLTLAGDAAGRCLPALEARRRGEILVSSAPGHADAALVAALAAATELPAADAPLPRPIYLRPPDTTTTGSEA